jgi:hypothetical protein
MPAFLKYARKYCNCLTTETIIVNQTAYEVDAQLGGHEALADLRKRLHARNMRLLVDFVPNHVAVDHPWTLDADKAQMLMPGTEEQLATEPQV